MRRVINIDLVYDPEVITLEGIEEEIQNILGVTHSEVILEEALND